MKHKMTTLVVCLLLTSCSLFMSTEDEIAETIEDFMESVAYDGARTAVNYYFRGDLKMDWISALRLVEVENGTANSCYDLKFKRVKEVHLLDDYTDVALALVAYEDKEATFVLHQMVSGDWKIYGMLEGDQLYLKEYIGEEDLFDLGIFTISDSELEDFGF